MEWILLKTLLSLAAVLGLMVGVVYVLKKYVYRGTTGAANAVAVEILGQRTLQPKRSIVVVKVLGSVFVVGMSEQGMQTLGTIDNEESLAALEDHRSAPALPVASTFSAQLQESLKNILHRPLFTTSPTPGNGHALHPTRRPRRRQ